MNKQEIERAIERLESLSRYVQILKDPSEFFHHMNGHTTELSLVLASFDIAEMSKEIQGILTHQLTNGWIAVGKELPSSDGRFEVTIKGSKGKRRVEILDFHKNANLYMWGSKWDDNHVIAWRRRPEPYKEVSE